MKKIPDDIKQLSDRIEKLRQKDIEKLPASKEGMLLKVSRVGFRIGIELLSAVIVGAALGYFVDMLLGTKPWCLVVFLFFGGAAGVLNVYKVAKQEDNQ